MRVRTLVASIAVLGVLATACANASEVPGSGSSGPGTIDHPTGSTDLLLRVSDEGGFVAPEYLLTAAPAFSLYGDGTVVTQGAQTEIYPGPALPPLIVTHITEDGIQALLRAALEAGSIPTISTRTWARSDRRRVDHRLHLHRRRRHARHEGVRARHALVRAAGRHVGRGVRGPHAARQFQGSLQDLRTTLPSGSVGDDAPFTPSGLRLFVTDYRAGDMKEPAVDWPLATPLSSTGGDPSEHAGYACVAVTGADLDALLPLAQSANQLTPWRSDGDRFTVLFRPLLPDESGC